jgi:hypothetical protein
MTNKPDDLNNLCIVNGKKPASTDLGYVIQDVLKGATVIAFVLFIWVVLEAWVLAPGLIEGGN